MPTSLPTFATQLENAPNSSPERRPDVLIAVMGSTGTGKSSFVQLITGDKSIKIGHGVESETSEVKVANYFEPDGRAVTFVDTPGFDDSREGVTDTMILKQISSFLEAHHKDGKKLNGIIYLHRITDPRMGGVSARNLRMFKKLCGADSLKNVVVVTTRWDTIEKKDEAEVLAREDDLMTNQNFFQPLVAAGASFLRHDRSPESARRIMEQLLEYKPVDLQIQVEMAEGKTLEETAAGTELNAHLNDLIEKHRVEMEEIRKETQEAILAKDELWRKELEQERDRRTKQLAKWDAEKLRLEEGLEHVKEDAEVKKRAMDEQLEQQRRAFFDEQAKLKEKMEQTEKDLQEEREKKSESERKNEELSRQLEKIGADRMQRQQVPRQTRPPKQSQEHIEQAPQYQQIIADEARARGAAEVWAKVAEERASIAEKIRVTEERATQAEERAKQAEERARGEELKARDEEKKARAAEERVKELEEQLEHLKERKWYHLGI